MARAMRLAVEAGRDAFLAGRMPRKFYAASPSSPTSGLIFVIAAARRRGAWLAPALFAHAMLAFAVPPTPQELAEWCANAEDASHCGRLVEAQQLKRLPGLATRDGDEPEGHAVSQRHDDVRRCRGPAWRQVVQLSGTTLDPINACVLYTTEGDAPVSCCFSARGSPHRAAVRADACARSAADRDRRFLRDIVRERGHRVAGARATA